MDNIFGSDKKKEPDFVTEIFGPDSAPIPKGYILNQGQQAALYWLEDFIMDPNHSYTRCLLEGWAGTGKTFTINRVIEAVRTKYPQKRKSFGMTAPTHKAVRQLKKHSELKKVLDFGTIHSFLGLTEQINEKTGEVTYKLDWNSNKERKIDAIDVLIVDEASMLRDDLYGHIDDVMRSRSDLKVIFMGDGLQIPPIRDEKERKAGANADAIPFIPAQRQSRRIYHLQLTDIVRQGAGNPIIEYSAAIREQVKKQDIIHEFRTVDDTGVVLIEPNRQNMLDLFRKYFCTPEFDEDPDYAKVVCYTNKTVGYVNQEIRLMIHNAETLPRIVLGEKLVMNKALVKGDKILIANNEELEVKSLDIHDLDITYKLLPIHKDRFKKMTGDDDGPTTHVYTKSFKCYRCIVFTSDDRQFVLNILHEDDEAEFNKISDSIRQAALKLEDRFEKSEMWKHFYKLSSHFAWVGYNYAITAHKAQGSTYDYAISMEWDMNVNRNFEERNRIKYVAATRARKLLYVFR